VDRDVAYSILEISPQATPEEIRAAYRRRAFATHPDRHGGDAGAFRAVADAYRCLCAPALAAAPEPAAAPEADTAPHVPPTDAAKVLFEYLSDLASEMILNGATPESVVAFLAREGCPESVARALERDLRERVRPEATVSPTEPPSAARPRAQRLPTWLAATMAAAAAFVLGASLLALRARTGTVPVVAPAAAPAPTATAPSPAPPPRAPAPAAAAPRPSAPPRPAAKQAPRPRTRERATAALGGTSGELDAERAALEADQRRFAAEAAELAAESERIDAAEAALGSASDVERLAALGPRKAAYNARVEVARRKEKELQRRVRELNAKITAYNERVRAER
jgi:hypothetical protein